MRAGFPDFRLGSVLATSFTGTLSERRGNAVERIPTPQRLVDWLAVNGLAVDSCTTAQLPVKPVGAAMKAFRKRREAIEEVAVTFTPAGGTPYTETAKLDFYAPRRR